MQPFSELHEVERVAVEPAQASIDDRLGVIESHIGKNIEVRHVFRVNLNVVGGSRPLTALQARDERSQEILDAGVDVAAVERGETVVDELEEGVHDVVEVDWRVKRVAVGELPASVDDATHAVAGRKLDALGAGQIGDSFHIDPFEVLL